MTILYCGFIGHIHDVKYVRVSEALYLANWTQDIPFVCYHLAYVNIFNVAIVIELP